MTGSEKLTAYFAHDDFISDLKEEFALNKIKIIKEKKNFFLTEGPNASCVWAQQTWENCEIKNFTSIKDAANQLRAISKIWMPSSLENHRRTMLIAENFKNHKPVKMKFSGKLQNECVPSYLLLDANTLLLSPNIFPAYPEGKISFDETKEAPSRAYLKLWESFTLHVQAPKKGQTCVDLGSCPGGWTWVLAKLGCKVWSVDKAPLDPNVEKLSNVTSIKKDAFTLKPTQALELFGLSEPLDWLFSDIICDPKRLLELVQEWRNAKAAKNFLCTIKFKGETDFPTLKKFLEIPGSKAFHLNHNKHEVTWLLTEKQ